MLADLKRYQDEQALKQELKNRAVQKAADYLAEHRDKITKAQEAMSALKKKYSYVPDSRDLSTAKTVWSVSKEQERRAHKENCFISQYAHSYSHIEQIVDFQKNSGGLRAGSTSHRTGRNNKTFYGRLQNFLLANR